MGGILSLTSLACCFTSTACTAGCALCPRWPPFAKTIVVLLFVLTFSNISFCTLAAWKLFLASSEFSAQCWHHLEKNSNPSIIKIYATNVSHTSHPFNLVNQQLIKWHEIVKFINIRAPQVFSSAFGILQLAPHDNLSAHNFNSLLLLVPFLILDAKRVISVDSCTIYHSSSPYIISPFQLQEFYCQQNHVWSPTPSHRSHILPHASSRSPRVVNKGIPLFCTHFIFSQSILLLLRDIDYTSTIPSC